MKKTLLFTIPILWSGFAMADTRMSLSECLAYAREHALDLRIEQLKSEESRMNRREQGMSFLPTINANASGYVRFGRGIDPRTNTYINDRTLGNYYGVGLSLPLFDGLVNVNSYRVARMDYLQARTESEIQQNTTDLDVVRQYYNMSYYQALVEQASLQLESDREQLRKTQRQEAVGQKSGADVDEIAATVATDEYTLLHQKNLLEQAELDLKFAMGATDMEGRLIVGMEDPSEMLSTLGEGLENSSDFSSSTKRTSLARYQMEKARYELKSARGQFSPTLDFNAGVNTSYSRSLKVTGQAAGFRQQWNDNMGQYLELNLSFPIFDRFHRHYNLRRKKFAYERSHLAYEKTIQTIEKEMQMAWMELEAARQEYLAAVASFNAQNTAWKANQRKFELGSLSALELQTSSAKKAAAEATMTGKLIQMYVKQIEWKYMQR